MTTRIAAIALAWLGAMPVAHAATAQHERIGRVVDAAIRPLMTRYDIAGMAVGITIAGATEEFDYGVASKASGQLVTHDTLFEIGSISKTLTATLAAVGEVNGVLSLSEPVSRSRWRRCSKAIRRR